MNIPFTKEVIGAVIIRIAIQVFVLAWLVDLVYDTFAPGDFQRFTYWGAVQMTLLFSIVLAAVRGK